MSEIDKFLTNPEDQEDNIDYIVPNIEAKLAPNKRQECREIVREIQQFGISQRQLAYLIYLLSLNLENNELMRKITKAVGEERDNVKIDISETKEGASTLKEAPSQQKKLILD